MRYIGVLAALGFLLAAAGSTMADSVWPDNLEGFWGLAEPESSDSWRFTVRYGFSHINSANPCWYHDLGVLLQARVIPLGTGNQQFLYDARPDGGTYPKITGSMAGWTNYADYGDVSVISGGTPFTCNQYPEFKFQFYYGDGKPYGLADVPFVLQLQVYAVGDAISPKPIHLADSGEFYFNGTNWLWASSGTPWEGQTGIGWPSGGSPAQLGAWNTTSPVPEPLTMAGLMLGIGGLVGYVRKRRAA